MPSNKRWAYDIFNVRYPEFPRFVTRSQFKTRKKANERARWMRNLVNSSFNVSDTRFEVVGPRRTK